jgi:hypothetical protein
MKTVKAFRMMGGVQVGIEGHRGALPELWVIDRAFVCGPAPQASLVSVLGPITPEHVRTMEEALTSQEETDAKNWETSAREVEAFKARTSTKWGGYFHASNKAVQTWMGDKLADVTWVGRIYKVTTPSGGRSERFNFRAKGIDGRTWAGTAYTSSGDYVSMRVVKG